MKMFSSRLGIVISAVLFVASLKTSSLGSALCSSDGVGDKPYKYYQTKTLYDTVRGEMSPILRPSDECTPIRIVMLIRHGSRHPGDDEADIFQSLSDLAKRVNSTEKAELCPEDLEKIRNWKNWHEPSLRKDLAVTGYKEMRGIAERYSKTFPELFAGSALNKQNYRFISSDSRRTKQSAETFIDKLFSGSEKVKSGIELSDELVKFYERCQRYITEIDDNDTVTEDVDRFFEGPRVTRIADDVARRLGVPRDEITNEFVDEIRKEGCAEEEWATGNDSAWCSAFTKEELQAFEYGEDMDDYVSKSFGHEISYKQSCKLKHFMLSALNNAPQERDTSRVPRGYFIFGHSTTVMSTLSEMKLIRDEGPLPSSGYPELVDRSFRASLYTPGAANLAFILYECGAVKETRLQIFLNEKPVRMPLEDPSPEGLWNFEEALRYFGFYNPKDCNWEEVCRLKNAEPSEGEEQEGASSRDSVLLIVAASLIILLLALMKA